MSVDVMLRVKATRTVWVTGLEALITVAVTSRRSFVPPTSVSIDGVARVLPCASWTVYCPLTWTQPTSHG